MFLKYIRFLKKKIFSFIYKVDVKLTAKKSGKGLKTNGRVIVTKNTELGDYVNFNGIIIQGKGNVKIGNEFHSGFGCYIMTSNHNYDNGKLLPYDETVYSKNVEIGDFVWLGNNVTILPGVKIGEGAIVGMGSVVTKDVPKYAVVGGNPARILKYRDRVHYNKLKEKKQFHSSKEWVKNSRGIRKLKNIIIEM